MNKWVSHPIVDNLSTPRSLPYGVQPPQIPETRDSCRSLSPWYLCRPPGFPPLPDWIWARLHLL